MRNLDPEEADDKENDAHGDVEEAKTPHSFIIAREPTPNKGNEIQSKKAVRRYKKKLNLTWKTCMKTEGSIGKSANHSPLGPRGP